MSEKKNVQTQRLPTRFKRIPKNSYTIIFQFTKKKDRDECINSEDFKDAFGELAKLLLKYNATGIEFIKFDMISGIKEEDKERKDN
ncbi:MAG: hypothetical protein ACTSVV_14200 [Promethearchaeota archaeon]